MSAAKRSKTQQKIAGKTKCLKTEHETRNVCVLVDMDGTIAAFEEYFLVQYRKKYPNEPYIPLDERQGMYCNRQYELMKHGLGDKCNEIIESKGFYLNLPPIAGAIDAMKEMAKMEGVDVFLCTSPLPEYEHCVVEKYEWVDKHLGKEWINRIIVASDKTLVRGDLLFDDNPIITGSQTPTFRHILKTYCHNRTLLNYTGCSFRLESWTPHCVWKKLIEDTKKNL